jgi:glycosyltransferase involved in cell wall biosynthesis
VSLALHQFRDAHRGETIVVCGCGPSLKELPGPERPITLGVNDVGRLFDPTYLVVVNPRTQFKADRFAFVEQSKAQVLFTQLDLGAVRPPVVRFKLGKFGGTDVWAGDVLHYTQNSPYVAVCLAAYMGARRIGLIGVDFTDGHFFATTGRHPLASRLAEIDAQYGRLAAALEKQGVELVNLSSLSRLASLPRARPAAHGGWTQTEQRSEPMKVAGESRSRGAVAPLLDTLADTARKLGYKVARDPAQQAHDPRAISIVWNGRYHRRGVPTLYCEHGWLPRSSYQISPRGINAASHAAPFSWDDAGLSAEEDRALDEHLAAIKSAAHAGYYRYMQADQGAATGVPQAFLLVPLQMEYDTNLVHHAPAHLRTMQALIDHVAGLKPPWPVIFKQHPMDAERGNRHLRLRVRRPQDMLWPHARGNVHQMLKSGACCGVVTINSNVAHDSLLWNVPAIVLGRNIWPTQGRVTPFLTAIPRDWSLLPASATQAEAITCRRAYMHFLMRNQWTLEDARDQARVAALIESAMSAKHTAVARSKLAAIAPRHTAPTINVVAENRGWLFEAWKQRFASAASPGIGVVASAKPLRQADAWIFLRAREAASSPHPGRTVVQLHDFYDGGLYRERGERACVRSCGALALGHASQRVLLAADGVELTGRLHIVQPVGWTRAGTPGRMPGPVPTVAWIGRAARHGGGDVSRFELFADAVRRLRRPARVVLAGERLEPLASELKRQGVDCVCQDALRFPLQRLGEWIGAFDCVAITAAGDAAPWPLFDALRAGVPVVSARMGWAGDLLADGSCGKLADTADAMREAIDEILGTREAWAQRRAALRSRVEAWSVEAWIRANLDLAQALMQPGARTETERRHGVG